MNLKPYSPLLRALAQQKPLKGLRRIAESKTQNPGRLVQEKWRLIREVARLEALLLLHAEQCWDWHCVLKEKHGLDKRFYGTKPRKRMKTDKKTLILVQKLRRTSKSGRKLNK
jgi:hypothetical protein